MCYPTKVLQQVFELSLTFRASKTGVEQFFYT